MVQKLIEDKTGLELKPGDRVITFRGETGKLISWHEYRNRVYVRLDGEDHDNEWFPSVINCHFVEVRG